MGMLTSSVTVQAPLPSTIHFENAPETANVCDVLEAYLQSFRVQAIIVDKKASLELLIYSLMC